MPKGKAEHPTHIVGINFVKHFLKEEFDFTNQTHKRVLRDAKLLVNPAGGGKAYDPSLIWGCLLALEKGMFGFTGDIRSMWIVTYGDYLKQYEEYVATAPAFYESDLIREWEEITGKVYPKTGDDAILNPHPFVPVME
jgi:hypothetical protein